MSYIVETVKRLVSEYQSSDPFILANVHDVNITYHSLPDWCGGYNINVKDQYNIIINSNNSDKRQKYTCAHELGHVLLHKDCNAVLFSDTRSPAESIKQEAEAHCFAVHLLLTGYDLYEGVTKDKVIDDLGAPDWAVKFLE